MAYTYPGGATRRNSEPSGYLYYHGFKLNCDVVDRPNCIGNCRPTTKRGALTRERSSYYTQQGNKSGVNCVKTRFCDHTNFQKRKNSAINVQFRQHFEFRCMSICRNGLAVMQRWLKREASASQSSTDSDEASAVSDEEVVQYDEVNQHFDALVALTNFISCKTRMQCSI